MDSVTHEIALPLPPEQLRFRVHGATDAESFLRVGEQCSNDLQSALESIGRTLDSFEAILDFGCGCGRTLRFLAPHAGGARLYGTDIDQEAIRWCHSNLPIAHFLFNDAFPPISYQRDSFDLIYAISVFTHLDEVSQFAWLYELNRLTKPGGIVVLTTHGEAHLAFVPEPIAQATRQQGFLFVASNGWKNIFPDWYQDSFHTTAYIHEQFSRFFDVLSVIPAGMNNLQDVVLLQRKAENDLLAEPPLPAWARIVQLERELGILHRTVAKKNDHIRKLEDLITKIESGRIMRLFNAFR